VTDASEAVTPAHGETLFGMDVPSLEELDASEAATEVRAAIVGTYADWAHTPDFPRAFADDVNAARSNRATRCGASSPASTTG
jgi:hypothetical protein